MQRSRDLLPFLGALSLPFFVVLADETATILKSSVRIIEGAVAADWELRFLAPERAETLSPDHDPAKTPDIPPRPVEEARSTQKASSTVGASAVQGARKVSRPPAPTFPAHDTPDLLPEKPPVPPRPVVMPSPAAPAPNAAPPAARVAPKVAKTADAAGANAEKRKKERREILREERKERDYRNRRIE